MTSILELNQDCLNNIFKYFTIYELIDVEETCSAFKATCDSVYKSKKFHSLRLELRYLRADYLDAIFERVGRSLRAFEFSGGFIMDEKIKRCVIGAVSEKFPKLQKLRLNYVQFDNAGFDELQRCFPNLTYLDLSHCAISENELQHCLDGDKLKNIKTLKLAGNVNLTGCFFKDMWSVEVLDCSYCFELRYYHFLEFLKNCKKLRELNATASCQLIPEDRDILSDLLHYQPFLEKIIMDNVGVERNDQVLAQFKHLKTSSFTGRRFGT